jgi:hypothetical protein
MTASGIFFRGKFITVPGSYSEIDASGLEAIGLGATGRVAMLGTAEGGRPVSTITETKDIIRYKRPENARTIFKSGQLREGSAIAFDPSRDADIPGGAQEIIAMKVNPATQSSATLSAPNGTVATVTSEDYAAYTEQINLEIATGTSLGKLLTVRLEDDTEVLDNVGGTAMFTVQYTEAAAIGWDTMRMDVLASGLRAWGTRAEAGLDAHVLAAITSGENVRVTATAGDAGKTITVYGKTVGDVPQRETITLINGTVSGALLWGAVYGAALSATAAGTVLVEEDAGGFTDLISITVGLQYRGLVPSSTMFVANTTLQLLADAATTREVHLWGRTASGAALSERVVLTGATPVVTVASTWTQIDVIVLGDLEAARTLTIAGVAVQTLNTSQNTLQKASDYFNARQVGVNGFVFTMVSSLTSFLVADLDLTQSAVDVDNPATGSFYADLFFVLDFYDGASSLVDAARIAFTAMATDLVFTVANTTLYTFTLGGVVFTYTSSGAATLAEIVNAFVARVNAHPTVNRTVVASNATNLRITASTPSGFVLAESDANISTTAIATTAGVGTAPSNTTAPIFLTGGSEGVALFSHYQAALDLLKRIRVDSVVPLTPDPAVHAAVVAHCDFMAGLGRAERDAFVGLMNAAQTGLATKNEVKSQIIALNTRHVRALAQSFERFDTSGERVSFDPPYLAALAAGMQAGATVGTSLTFKLTNTLSLNQHSTWNPLDDAEEMINGGLMFAEEVDGLGRRFVRNITTHLSSSNLAFIEGSVNQAVNYSAFNFRTSMEVSVGKKGFSGTLNAAKSVAIGILGQLVDQEVLVAYQALSLDLALDVLEVSAEIAPIIPINFVKNILHLVTVRQAA